MTHPLLEYYVKKAEEMELGISMTLYVNGLIIEGITTSQKRYYEDIWTVLTSANSSDESNRDKMEIVNSSLRGFMQLETEKEKTPESVPEYIYLTKVKMYRGSAEDFILTPHWVGKLSSVDGFYIGIREDEGDSE